MCRRLPGALLARRSLESEQGALSVGENVAPPTSIPHIQTRHPKDERRATLSSRYLAAITAHTQGVSLKRYIFRPRELITASSRRFTWKFSRQIPAYLSAVTGFSFSSAEQSIDRGGAVPMPILLPAHYISGA